jgi:predicted secreted protein
MFDDARSRSLVLVAHCILNQNAISDGTATRAGSQKEIVELLLSAGVGVIQLPCPELRCLGLDRGDTQGAKRPVLQENSRIRRMMHQPEATAILDRLVQTTIYQVRQYQRHGFDIRGVVGINRSPSCGVESTSRDDTEVPGRGLFIEALEAGLRRHDIVLDFVGIKADNPERAVLSVRRLLDS